MATARLKFKCPAFYDLSMTCHVHGWKNLSPFFWNDQNSALQFAALIETHPVDIDARQTGDAIQATVTSHETLDRSALQSARAIIRRSLGLDMDTSELLAAAEKVGPDYAGLVRKGAGRLLRSPTLWEDAAKTLFTTNCSWSLTKKMCSEACSERFSQKTPFGIFPFPAAERFVRHSPAQLKQMLPVGYRSTYLHPLAETFAADPTLQNLETDGFNYKAADKLVRRLKGFADYATAHLLILAGFYDEVPVDTVVVAYLKRTHRVRKPKSFIHRHYRKWGRYKWWGLKLEKMLNRQNWLGD